MVAIRWGQLKDLLAIIAILVMHFFEYIATAEFSVRANDWTCSKKKKKRDKK
jgi:hypothetical protein